MSQLVAGDALTSSVKRVSVYDRAGYATPSVFAVYETDEPDSPLMGLVTLEQAAGFTQRIFADLLPKRRSGPVWADADLETVSEHMESEDTGALAVIDHSGHLLGAVTRESLWAAMLAQQRSLMAELATREAQQRAMLNAIPDELLCINADGKLLEIRRPLPGDPDSMVARRVERIASEGRTIADAFPRDVAATLMDGVARSLTSGLRCQGAFSICEDNVIWQYEARFAPWGRGNVLIVCRDVTEVNALRAKLVISDRMVSIGTLAAGVAHEINNPLTYISTNLALLGDVVVPEAAKNPRLHEVEALLEDIREGVDRVQRTVRDLKLFSRSEEPSRSVVDLREVLRRVVRIANNEIRHRARLAFELGAIPAVNANDAQMGQVLLNLLVNAAQSIKEGAADRNEIRVVTRTDDRGRAVVEIHDTGAGIPDEIRPRIFAPFFTTKGSGVGTGLGLSICHGIVVGHAGEIDVESTVGKGTVFRVTLPAHIDVTSAPAAPSPPSPSSAAVPALQPRPSGRFLVVDDETAILGTYPRLLGAGQCVTCSSGRQALELLQRGERFDIILCDLMMPQTSGMDVHAELLRIAPEQAARMIFVTGGAFSDGARQFLAALTQPALDKPFTAQQLFGRMNDMMKKMKE